MGGSMKPIQTISQSPLIYTEKQQEDEIRSEDGLAVSEEVYWDKYYEYCGDSDFSYEWNNGYLEEKPVSDYLNILMYQWFVDLLRRFLEVRPIAKLLAVEMGFRLALPGKTAIRKPDLAVVLETNPVKLNLTDHSYAGIYDLCVELLSDTTLRDIQRDTVEKKLEYATIGVKEYFILDARGSEMAFYRRNIQGKYEHIPSQGKDVIRSEVLPGFQFRISDLYRQPSLKALSEDSIYREFILVGYQAEKRRADQAEKLLMLERQSKEQEKQRADRLAEKLRSMGISPES
jgi:Uma2 family endonuclease